MNFRQMLRIIMAHAASSLLSPAVMRNKRFFQLWENRGYHVTPNHFYEPIPDTRTLGEDLWQEKSELVGIDMNRQGQLNLLSEFAAKFKREYDSFALTRESGSLAHEYYIDNGNFGSVDGEILYSMIRFFKPKTILEIGSGFSTFLSARAALRNREEDEGYRHELFAIEPYPNDTLKAGFPGLSALLPKKVQDISLTEFEKLRENDILFIDSSHVLRIGGDVRYEFLEILPRLNKGVLVHIHDIFLPAEYPREWVLKKYLFWTEQYLLQAFLTFNDSYEILWAGSYMHLKYPEKLGAAFNSYRRNETWPGSFWIRKIR